MDGITKRCVQPLSMIFHIHWLSFLPKTPRGRIRENFFQLYSKFSPKTRKKMEDEMSLLPILFAHLFLKRQPSI